MQKKQEVKEKRKKAKLAKVSRDGNLTPKEVSKKVKKTGPKVTGVRRICVFFQTAEQGTCVQTR